MGEGRYSDRDEESGTPWLMQVHEVLAQLTQRIPSRSSNELSKADEERLVALLHENSEKSVVVTDALIEAENEEIKRLLEYTVKIKTQPYGL